MTFDPTGLYQVTAAEDELIMVAPVQTLVRYFELSKNDAMRLMNKTKNGGVHTLTCFRNSVAHRRVGHQNVQVTEFQG